MFPSGKKYKKEYAFELLKIAQGDLDSARVLSRTNLGRPENANYLTHECIAKCLKAVLVFEAQEIVHTHNVEALVQLIPKSNPTIPDAHLLGSLTQYATIRRYEEGYEDLSSSDIKLVIELGEKILNWANSRIPLKQSKG